MKVDFIPSRLPGWYDPDAPGFCAPANWSGCHVHMSVTVNSDPARELAEARAVAEKRYPGAVLHVVPKYEAAPNTQIPDITGSDEQLILRYLEANPAQVPAGATTEQMAAYIASFLPGGEGMGVRKLQFLGVEAHNVLCFEHCELNLDRIGVTLVTGRNHDWEGRSNGSGKSSLVTLPFLALFGRSFKNQQHDAWARQGTDKSATIVLKMCLPDGTKLNVIRGRRPPLLRVMRDGREVTMGDVNQTQALIERLTNLTWSVLTNAVYIGQREIGSVFGTDKERQELFTRLLGLDRYLEAQEKLRRALSKRAAATAEAERAAAAADAEVMEAGRGLEELRIALEAAPAVDPKDIAEQGYCVQDMNAKAAELERQNAALEPTLATNQAQFEQLLTKVIECEQRIETYRHTLDQAATVKRRCPTCGSSVSVQQLENYTAEVEEQLQAQEKLLEKYEALQTRNRTARQAVLEKVQTNQLRARQLRTELEAARESLGKAQAQAEARYRLQLLWQTRTERVAELKRRAVIDHAAHRACLQEQAFTEACVRAVGRDGLPAYLCQCAVPQLNAAAARYAEVFADGEIGVRFAVSGSQIAVEVDNMHGGAAARDQSMGEMRMAALVCAFAFRDALVPHNLLVVDEPSEGLDAANAAQFARGLNQVVERFQHVIVISHNERFLAALEPDHHLRVEKRGGVASIIQA